MQSEPEKYIDNFCTLLHKENLKCTPVRENTLRIFFQNNHIELTEIISLLETKHMTTVSKQTVYNTLKLFISFGIISKNKLKGKIIYELIRNVQHFHLYCQECKQYFEFQDHKMLTLAKELSKNKQFKMHELDMTIYGICSSCTNKKTK